MHTGHEKSSSPCMIDMYGKKVITGSRGSTKRTRLFTEPPIGGSHLTAYI
jgi:hypothetical protein